MLYVYVYVYGFYIILISSIHIIVIWFVWLHGWTAMVQTDYQALSPERP